MNCNSVQLQKVTSGSIYGSSVIKQFALCMIFQIVTSVSEQLC